MPVDLFFRLEDWNLLLSDLSLWMCSAHKQWPSHILSICADEPWTCSYVFLPFTEACLPGRVFITSTSANFVKFKIFYLLIALRAIICVISQILVEVPNSSLGMEQLDFIRAESGSIHPVIVPDRSRAVREHIRRDGNRLRPGYGPTDSGVPMKGQGRKVGRWTPVMLWSWWSRVWCPQGMESWAGYLGAWAGTVSPVNTLSTLKILFLNHWFPRHLIFKYNVNS